MTRDEFLDFLARAAADPAVSLTEQEAALLLALFDAGEIDPAWIPPPLAESIPTQQQAQRDTTNEDGQSGAWLIALALLYSVDGLQERHGDNLRRTARRAMRGGNIRRWVTTSIDINIEFARAQYYAGRKSPAMDAAEAARAADTAREQAAYFTRFADEAAARRLRIVTDTGLSEIDRDAELKRLSAWAENRAALYTGTGRTEFYKGAEYGEREGYVFDYEARDDAGTCSPCATAENEGPYLSGTGPYPGTICLGGGRCRCRRVPRYDPAAYRRLTGA